MKFEILRSGKYEAMSSLVWPVWFIVDTEREQVICRREDKGRHQTAYTDHVHVCIACLPRPKSM